MPLLRARPPSLSVLVSRISAAMLGAAAWTVLGCEPGSDAAVADTAPTPDQGATPDASSEDASLAAEDASLATDVLDGDAATAADGFTFVSAEPGDCPLSTLACARDWPATGTVTQLRSEERFRGRTHQRTAWLHRPAGTDGMALPLLVFLHGGNGNGAKMFARSFDELARGETVSWTRNDAECSYTHPGGFTDGAGAECEPQSVEHRSTQPFALLLPDGIESSTTRIPDARHWEDGRIPSPGQARDEEVRDDVGFLAHLLEVVARESTIDARRIYLVGWSNGGMMTQRVLCELHRPGLESLRSIAAAVVGIASLPAALEDGTARPRCEPSSETLPPTMFVVGRGIATPDCDAYPCSAPTTDGDGTMPFGAPGERHRVHSPDLGYVIAFEDTRALFESALGSPLERDFDEMRGLYTVESAARRAGSVVEIRTLVTDGGAHEQGGGRHDFALEGRQWAFLSSFARASDGSVEVGSPLITGTY